MGQSIINVFVIVAFGVMLADALSNPGGVKAIFDGVGGIWRTSVNGMLAKTS